MKLGGQRCGAVGGSAVTQIHACCPGSSSRALQRCPGHCCNSQLTNQRSRNRCRVHTDWQIELIVFIHYIRILSSVTMPTCDVLLRHFRKMLLWVRIRGCTLSSLIYSCLHTTYQVVVPVDVHRAAYALQAYARNKK